MNDMIDPALLTIVVKQLSVVIALALVGAAAAERLGSFRWLGGLVVGCLLSSAVAGTVAPGGYQRLFIGGAAERAAVARAEQGVAEAKHRVDQYIAELQATGVTDGHVVSQRSLKRAEWVEPAARALAAAQARLTAAKARHARVRLALTWAAALLAAAGAGMATRWRRWWPTLADAIPVALSAAVVAGLTAAAGAALLGRLNDPAGGEATFWLVGLMIGCGIGAVPLAGHWVERLDRHGAAPSLDDRAALAQATALLLALAAMVALAAMPAAGLLEHAATDAGGGESPTAFEQVRWAAMIGAIALAALALAGGRWLGGRFGGPTTRVILALALATTGWFALAIHPLPLAFIAGLIAADGTQQPPRQSQAPSINPRPGAFPLKTRRTDAEHTAGDRLLWLAGPIIAALVAMRVDFNAPSIWLVLVTALVLGDARAIGAWLGARLLAGRSTGTGMRIGVANSVGGALPLAAAFALHAGNLIDAPLFNALILAAGLVTLLAPPTLRLARAVWPDDEPPDASPMQ